MHYTKNYHLPQWEKSDRIMMDDFNAMCGNLEAGLEKTASDASKRSDQIQASADAAMAAATHTHTDAKGNTYPLLVFDFSYTAKQSNGKTTTGTFSASYFLDEDGE